VKGNISWCVDRYVEKVWGLICDRYTKFISIHEGVWNRLLLKYQELFHSNTIRTTFPRAVSKNLVSVSFLVSFSGRGLVALCSENTC